MSTIKDTMSWVQREMVLAMLDEQKGVEGYGYHDVAAIVSTNHPYPP